ncbi:MAG TPA: hypothetical protein VLV46_09800 [Gaiellaceae bacterium]|nr:hypothetical protein [Gaiellaceae bacterium]
MPEGLSASEVGKEIGEHAHAHGLAHGRAIPITEALLLSVVAILAAWSGYSAAKWGTESSLGLAKASATRTKANRDFQQSLTFRVGDALTFNAWLAAYLLGNKNGARIAEKRFRKNFDTAFDAWIATHPFTNPGAPPGPQSMPQYRAPGAALSTALDAEADAYYTEGEHAAETGDKYVRTTVILASVLFLVGISTHFPLRGIRIGLIVIASALLVFGVVQILQLPGPPS